MRAAGDAYLPKEPREKAAAFARRLSRTVFFNGYLKTLESFVGVVFTNDITLKDDVPPGIATQCEDIDLAGTHIDVFAKQLFRDMFEGYAFILVDEQPLATMPPVTLAGITRADSNTLRPYWQTYKADQAINWRRARINGEDQFTQITFKEQSCEPDGEYGDKIVVRYRVFRRTDAGQVEWQLFELRKVEGQEEESIVSIGTGTTSLKRIPVAVIGELGAPPALLDLAYLNISHWRNCSDQENILHVTRVPMMLRKGAGSDAPEIEIGPTTIDIEKDGDISWIEINANGAMRIGREYLLDIEQRMGMMGLATLTQRAGTVITATEKKQDYKEKHSQLATMARGLKDGIEQALKFHAEYLGKDSGGSIELGVQEEELILSPQHLAVLLDAVKIGKFSLDSWLAVVVNVLSQTGMLTDVTAEDEAKRIAAKPPPVIPPPSVIPIPTAPAV
jgi:hypothetical protein